MRRVNFDCNDEELARLAELARKAGKTQAAVMRRLIMGRPLGDATARQTLARLSQLGALLTHCARELSEKGEGIAEFVAIGTEIREIALRLAANGPAAGMEDEDEADDNLQAD